ERFAGGRVRVDVPELDQVLTVRGDEDRAIRRERHAANRLALWAERLSEQLPVRDIPQGDRPVRPAFGELATVGAQREIERERRPRAGARKRSAELRRGCGLQQDLTVLQ